MASVAVELPGTVYFATRSPVWSGGGRAFYDPDAPGRALARARLVTVAQFSDIAAQEMYREPGEGPDLDLREVLARGRSVQGEGRYETLVCPGELSGHPLLTFTAPWSVAEAELNAPAAGYLAYLAGGLLAAGAWDAGSVAAYLANCPGAAGTWSERAVRELLGHGARS
ncbi:histone deacetylase [Streptomyces sp. NPDC004111]|uniref:histone deacetylase n=1 Tax=Streptomyces sp. NPDC004111 TaxID=3364690 RepID=UPI0036BBE04D